jgi:choline dehydrogenase-like flavoprotein
MGTLRMDDLVYSNPDLLPSDLRGGQHHCGTTRIGVNRKEGVVDRDLRVFGCDNLYLLGSSVFPTNGWVNPTFTIIALAIRLSEHLRGK